MNNKALKKYRQSKKGVLTNLYHKIKYRNKIRFGEDLDFDLKQFHNLFLNDYDYLKIYEKWESNGFNKEDKPSVDRINPDIYYKKNNIQIIPFWENRKKGEIERSRIVTSVSMYDLEGKYLCDFESIKKAVEITGIRQSSISACCQGKYKTAGGFVFKYKSSGYKATMEIIGNIHDKDCEEV